MGIAKFIKSLFLGLGFAALFYLAMVFLWGKFVPYKSLKTNLNYKLGGYGHSYSRFKDAASIGEVDILFLGSSHAYRGFDTRLFEQHGYKAFNFGTNAQTPVQTKLLIEKYLGKIKPRLVVMEVYPSILTSDGLESSLDIIANDKITWETIRMCFKINHIKTYNSLLYGLLRQTFHLDDAYLEPVIKENDTYVSKGGFVEKAVMHNANKVHKAESWIIRNYQLEAFKESIEILKQQKIPYLLVQAPITPSLYQSKINNEELDSIYISSGHYINFSKLVTLDDSLHFYDTHHLNKYGVEVFNRKLLEELESNLMFKQLSGANH
jgi:hypothetical protein